MSEYVTTYNGSAILNPAGITLKLKSGLMNKYEDKMPESKRELVKSGSVPARDIELVWIEACKGFVIKEKTSVLDTPGYIINTSEHYIITAENSRNMTMPGKHFEYTGYFTEKR